MFGAMGPDLFAPQPPPWASLPDPDLAYHVAHELTHMVMSERGFPRAARGSRYSEASAESRTGGDLEEMILHPSLHEIISPFGFRWDFIQNRMREGVLKGLGENSAPERGTPWFFTWAIRYCELRLELPSELWSPLSREAAGVGPGNLLLAFALRGRSRACMC